MLQLRLKNPVPVPQKNGSFVVEAAKILVHDRSRKAAEDKATKKFLSTPDPYAFRSHPLVKTKAVTIEMDYDEDAKAFVTYVKELHRMSSFGDTENTALDKTAEMIRGYIKSMEGNRKRIPLSAARLTELKRVLDLR